MSCYNGKSKEELLAIIEALEAELQDAKNIRISQKELGFRKKYATRILDALTDMLVVLDYEGRLIEILSQDNIGHILDVPPAQLANTPLEKHIPPKEYARLKRTVQKAITTGKPAVGEHSLMLGNTLHHFEHTISPLDDGYLLCVCRNISKRVWAYKELEKARIKAEEADKLKSSFLANMSHEIRTPLNAIVGFAKLAIEAKGEKDKWGYIDMVDKNSDLLLNLFNDILDLSAIESDSLSLCPRPVVLYEICLDQFERHCHTTQPGVKLILDEVNQEMWITTDWDRLGQIVSNLLNNAIKFTQEGEIHYGFERKGNVIQFYVKDTGIGISANKIATIFQRFGKVNNFVQGTGLGLSLSRMLVEKMGGRIWARSKEGQGTTFYFTLPLNQTI